MSKKRSDAEVIEALVEQNAVLRIALHEINDIVYSSEREKIERIASSAIKTTAPFPFELLRAKLAAYKAHRDEFNHLANCKNCKKGMNALCSKWEILAVNGCGRADFAVDSEEKRIEGKP